MIAVIDDHNGVCSSLRALLESADLQVRNYSSAEAYLASEDLAKNDCLLVDIHLPGMSGVELQEELNRRDIRQPIIIITGHADVPLAVKAMHAGAFDFLEKPFDDEVLLRAIAGALAATHRNGKRKAETCDAETRLASLTTREMDVFRRMAQGESSKVIGLNLGISYRTVEIHRGRVQKKLGAKSIAEVIRIARAAQLLY
jgi:two-component system response regulator FixJ